ncbi:MAG: MoxR family ATPase [Lachnospiraceae bacterium]|jgi:MoxR-like ATPase|nr:MoxR family ATPase [Lachnospiraceae bacterium]
MGVDKKGAEMTIDQVVEKAGLIRANMARVIVGKEDTIHRIMCVLCAGGNILLEDVPGTGKTKLAKTLAKSIGGIFSRIQFTPDLLPSDITGINVYNRKENDFVLRKGPVFTNILLADEINRATPRTQAGLLECMEERQVTIDGVGYELSHPFFVIATQNPIETAGTYPLPEAQLDRFMMKVSLGAPDKQEEMAILERFMNIDATADPFEALTAVVSIDDVALMQQAADRVYVHPVIREYIADIAAATRTSAGIIMGVSPRASLALLRCAKVHAAFAGREYCIPDDIKALAVPVLAHRLILNFGYKKSKDNEYKIKEILSSVNTPTENFSRG